MLRVKILKDNKHGKAGEIISMDRNEAFGLIDSGFAEITKDMTGKDYKVNKSDEVQADDRPKLRTVRK